jgi:hypothetical protein
LADGQDDEPAPLDPVEDTARVEEYFAGLGAGVIAGTPAVRGARQPANPGEQRLEPAPRGARAV